MALFFAIRDEDCAVLIPFHFNSAQKSHEPRSEANLVLRIQRGSALFHRILEQCGMDKAWPNDERNCTRAFFLWCLGIITLTYSEGGGASLDHSTRENGIGLLLKAAELGEANAASALSVVYSGSYPGIEANPQKHIYWLKKQAEWGIRESDARNLAYRYAQGDGVPEDRKMARKWTKRAALRGCQEAYAILHECCNQSCTNQDATGTDLKKMLQVSYGNLLQRTLPASALEEWPQARVQVNFGAALKWSLVVASRSRNSLAFILLNHIFMSRMRMWEHTKQHMAR